MSKTMRFEELGADVQRGLVREALVRFREDCFMDVLVEVEDACRPFFAEFEHKWHEPDYIPSAVAEVRIDELSDSGHLDSLELIMHDGERAIIMLGSVWKFQGTAELLEDCQKLFGRVSGLVKETYDEHLIGPDVAREWLIESEHAGARWLEDGTEIYVPELDG